MLNIKGKKLMNSKLLNLLIKLKNASMVRKDSIIIKEPNKLIFNLLTLLYNEGMIQSFIKLKNSNEIQIYLRYSYNKDLFKNLKVFAKATILSYISYNDICKLSNKRFLLIFSTNQGFMTGLQCKKQHLGGKLCFIC